MKTKSNYRERFQCFLEKILGLPTLAWVFLAFLICYMAFFLKPMFLNSDLSIQYIYEYIPQKDNIGFDIWAFMSYVDKWLISNQSPYIDGFIAYPPLTVILFAPLHKIGYPAYFTLITIVTIVLYTCITLLIPLFTTHKRNTSLVLFFYITGLFSYGLQFELERGQSDIIAFAFCLLAIYLYHYHEKFRYFAYILFSISIQLKLYPAIFVVMFIKDWRKWKDNIRRVLGLALFNVGLLFVLGYRIFLDFVAAIIGAQGYQSSSPYNLSIKGFVGYLVGREWNFWGASHLAMLQQNAQLIEYLLLALFSVCLFFLVASAYKNNTGGVNPYLLLASTVGALIIPSISNDYKLPLLHVPMLVLLGTLPRCDNYLKKSFSLILIVVTSIAYWSTFYPFMVKPDFLSRNFIPLVVILMSITALSIIMGGEYEPMYLVEEKDKE
ncbi:MAG: glycosyltransferase family 87 protein [Chloroflexota bacterium]